MPNFPPIPSAGSISSATNSAVATARATAGGIQLPFDPRELGSTLVQAGTNLTSTGQQLSTFSADLRVVSGALGNPLISSGFTLIEQKLSSFRNYLLNIAVSQRAAGGVFQGMVNFVGFSFLPVAQAFNNSAAQFEEIAAGLREMANTVRAIKDQVTVLRNKVTAASDSVEQSGNTMVQAGAAMVTQGRRLGG